MTEPRSEDIVFYVASVARLRAENGRLREALEALVYASKDDGSIDYRVSDFAIAALHGPACSCGCQAAHIGSTGGSDV